MATQYDPSSGTFVDDGVDDSPPGYAQPLTNALNGSTQPPPLDTGYTAPLQKALAQTAAPQNPQSPGGQDGLALPSVDVTKIADQVANVGKPKPIEVPPLPDTQTPANVATPPVAGAPPVPGAPNPAVATATHHTVLSPESQQAIAQLETATGKEAAAQTALGETRAAKADDAAKASWMPGSPVPAGAHADPSGALLDNATGQVLNPQGKAILDRQQRVQARLQTAQADYDNRVKEYDQQYTKLKSMHETDFYADKSTAYKIGAAISIALGAVSQAFGGKNVGAELIGKEIEAHAARQRNEITNQREIVEKAHVGLEGAKNEKDRQSLLWETAAFDRAAADVQARAAQFGGQEERQKAAVISAQLQQKGAEKKALLLKMTGEQVVTDTGRQTEADRLAAIKAQAAAKAKAKGAGGGDGGGHAAALQELIDGASAADVQAKYKIGDKALGKLVTTATAAQKTGTGAATENNPLAVHRPDGSVAGLAASTRNVKQIEDRLTNYEDAETSLRELLKSGDKIPIGSPAYNRAVIAIATVTTANSSDKTTEHEAATIKQYGLLNKDAIQKTLDHIKARHDAFEKQLRPLRSTTASASAGNPYVDAAKSAKAQLSGGNATPAASEAVPPGGIPGTQRSTGKRGYKLDGVFHAFGG